MDSHPLITAPSAASSALSQHRYRAGSVLLAVLALVLSACGGQPSGGGEGEGPPGGECAVTIASDITIPTRLTDLGPGCDYQVYSSVNITAPLTIEAGTEVQFAQDTRWHITDSGSISAVGTEDKRITLRGAVNTTGYWYGLCFSDNRASRLEWVDLLNAGKVWLGGTSVCRAAIGHGYGDGEPISIVATMVALSHTTGLDATQLQLGQFQNNIFAANQEYGVRVSAGNLHHLDATSDYAGTSVDAPNGKPFVHLADKEMSDPGETHVWPRLNAPYFIGEDEFDYHQNVIITDDTHVQVEPGTTFVFGQGGGINVWELSTFTAVGTADQPVVFTGQMQEPGSWEGLAVSNGALILDHAEVSWGGADGFYAGNISISGVGTTQDSHIANSLIRGSATCGLFVTEDTQDRVFDGGGNVFEDNVQDLCLGS